jgi:hypothetical protein
VRLLVIDRDGSRREYQWARRLNAVGQDVPYWVVLVVAIGVGVATSLGP